MSKRFTNAVSASSVSFFSWWLARIPRYFLDLLCLFLGFVLAVVLVNLSPVGIHDVSRFPDDWHAGCAFALFTPAVLVALFLVFGLFVRYAGLGLEPTVLSMPVTGFFYRGFFRPIS